MLKVWRCLPMRQKYQKIFHVTTCFLSLIFCFAAATRFSPVLFGSPPSVQRNTVDFRNGVDATRCGQKLVHSPSKTCTGCVPHQVVICVEHCLVRKKSGLFRQEFLQLLANELPSLDRPPEVLNDRRNKLGFLAFPLRGSKILAHHRHLLLQVCKSSQRLLQELAWATPWASKVYAKILGFKQPQNTRRGRSWIKTVDPLMR